MKQMPIILTLVVILIGLASVAFAQRLNLGKLFRRASKSEITYLTETDLDQAVQIVYATSSGSLPPEHHYRCVLTAEPTQVRMKVSGSYGAKQLYDQTFPITDVQWQEFKAQLIKYQIGNNPKVEPTCGGKGGSIEVYSPEKLLFRAIASEGLVYQGRLANAFVPLLPDGQPQQIIQDPSILLRIDEE